MHSQKQRNGSVAQLNRVLDYGSSGSRFESWRSHKAAIRDGCRCFFISPQQSLSCGVEGVLWGHPNLGFQFIIAVCLTYLPARLAKQSATPPNTPQKYPHCRIRQNQVACHRQIDENPSLSIFQALQHAQHCYYLLGLQN